MRASGPTLISEETVARLAPGSILKVDFPYIVTPSAAELIRHRHIKVSPLPAGSSPEESAAGACASAKVAPSDTDAPNRGESGTLTKTTELNLAGFIESTLLDLSATRRQIESLSLEARDLGFAGVCVNPLFVRQAAKILSGSPVRTVSVCGFPLGASTSRAKAFEAHGAVAHGADEIDMVLALGLFLTGELKAVVNDVREVRRALGPDGLLKVIIEAPLLSPEQIVQASVLALEGGADFIKTGTGFRGPVRPHEVELIRRVVGDRAQIKAAGGIRERKAALSLLAAGADRLGTSRAKDLL